MKKKSFFILLFFFSTKFIFAQGKIEGGLYGEYFQLGDKGFQELGGMLHIPFAERFTINYQLTFGTSYNGGFFVHAPGGVVAYLWLSEHIPNFGGISYFTTLLCVVPEGVGYYLPTKGKLLTHLSINPLGVEYFYHGSVGEEWGKLGCSFVARCKMQTNLKIPTYIAPQIAATYIYTPGRTTAPVGVRVGVTIGFEKKDK